MPARLIRLHRFVMFSFPTCLISFCQSSVRQVRFHVNRIWDIPPHLIFFPVLIVVNVDDDDGSDEQADAQEEECAHRWTNHHSHWNTWKLLRYVKCEGAILTSVSLVDREPMGQENSVQVSLSRLWTTRTMPTDLLIKQTPFLLNVTIGFLRTDNLS